MQTIFDYDTVIIGGGPGGSATGTFLARGGQKVLILEKEFFPRFHIGESLLPFGNDVFKAMGIWEKLGNSGFMPKWGAEFTTGNSKRFNRFWFSKGLVPGYEQTFQVERSRFDHVLLQHAQEEGCEVKQGHKVIRVQHDSEGGTVSFEGNGTQKEIRCRWVVDASGRDAFMGCQENLPREELHIPKRIAIYAHFKGVYRNPGEAGGHITIVRLKEGWCWFIPLDKEKTSVGLVQWLEGFKQSGLSPDPSFQAAMAEQPELKFRMKSAEKLSETCVTSDYTYRHKSFAASRMLMVGDAAGFIDPIFSSGVMIALKSGQLAAQKILSADSRKAPLAERECRAYTLGVKKMIGVYLGMIRMFYDQQGFEVFVQPNSRLGLASAVNSVVAGNTISGFGMWWRVKLFFLICWLQKWIPIARRLDFDVAESGKSLQGISEEQGLAEKTGSPAFSP